MFTVFNELGFVVMEIDDVAEADFFAWLYNGYYILNGVDNYDIKSDFRTGRNY